MNTPICRSSFRAANLATSLVALLLGAACGDDSGTGGAGGTGATSSSGSTSSTGSTSGSTASGSTTGAGSTSGGQGGEGGDGQGGIGGNGQGGDGAGGIGGNGQGGDGAGGIGGNGQGGSGQGGAPSCEDIPSTDIPGNACDAVAEAICETFETCFPFVLTLITGTKADCLPWAYGQCVQNNEQPGDPNSAADYEACAEVAVNAPCGCEGICGPPTPGTQADGDACMDDSQCASRACRGSEGYIECGTCWARGLLGDACSGLEVRCDDGLHCAAASGNCETKLANGETCGDSDECESDVCYGFECIAPLGLGEDCSGDGGDGACSLLGDGLWCDPGTSLCAPFPVGGAGDVCGLLDPDPLTVAFCAGNLRCSEDFPGTGICIARDAEDEACSLVGDQPNESTCLPHLHCVGGACVVPTPILCE